MAKNMIGIIITPINRITPISRVPFGGSGKTDLENP
ncbi:unnamed protein product, partial [marine sediment metagenome]